MSALFSQRFRARDGRVIIIRWWSDGRAGASLCDVDGASAHTLDRATQDWAYGAVSSRMAEFGEHRDEPPGNDNTRMNAIAHRVQP